MTRAAVFADNHRAMDFRLTAAEAQFQGEVHDWLVANLPAGWGTPDYRKPEDPGEKVRFARWWQRRLFEGGWAGLHWPREYGGRGATPVEQFLFAEEYTRAGAPPMIDIGVGPALVGPTLIHHGTEAQKQRFLRTILTGEEIWCQGFSEPNAGSDLAACRTRAELRGDVFHVTGQKIWTSYARFADWCILVVRTDPNLPKHKGLSFLSAGVGMPPPRTWPLSRTPCRRGTSAVMMEVWAGSVSGVGEIACRKRKPSAARRSSAGVSLTPPIQPSASGRRVSIVTSRTFGGPDPPPQAAITTVNSQHHHHGTKRTRPMS